MNSPTLRNQTKKITNKKPGSENPARASPVPKCHAYHAKHHVGKGWLSFHPKALLSLGRSRAISRHAGFRGFFGWSGRVGSYLGGFINWGGFRWRFIGSNWAGRWVLRVVFLIFRAPFQAQPMVICGYFFTFTASLCGIVVQYSLRTRRPGFKSRGVPFVSRACDTLMLVLSPAG